MRDLIKRLVERLYYKCYPDRVNDHDIATQPIEPLVIKEERDIVTLKTEIIIRDCDPFNPPIEYIEKEIKRNLGERIIPEIIKERDERIGLTIYTGSLRIARSRRDYVS